MVTDIRINKDMDVELDGANDLATISGHGQLEQSLALDVMDELQNLVGGRISGHNIGLLEERLREALNDDPQVGDIAYVNIVEFDKQRGAASAEVGVVENDNFSIEVSV